MASIALRLGSILGLVLTLCASLPGAMAATINVACASNFKPTLEQLALVFQQQTGHIIRISSASSGVLFAQINNGAPFQLFFSADAMRPEKLVEIGKADSGSLKTYAIGRLVLLHHQDNSSTPASIVAKARRIAIANPGTAPYGVAARLLLDRWVLRNDVQILQGNNIAQALQFFQSGNADVALIAATLLSEQQRQQVIELTPLLAHPIEQKAVIINPRQPGSAAREFLAFIDTDAAKKIITDSGYLIPL